MTFKEKLQKEHPELVSERYPAGCRGCPCTYGYESEDEAGNYCYHLTCIQCWNREIPEMEEEKVFKKENLENGMIIETREGERYMVLEDHLIREEGFLYLSEYNDDLSFQDNNVYDIMKVWKTTIRAIKAMLNYPGNPIWTRQTPKEMTVKEIEMALGYPVKIVKEQ